MKKLYDYKIIQPEKNFGNTTDDQLRNGQPNKRSFVPFFEDGQKELISNADEPDDPPEDLDNSEFEDLERVGQLWRCPNPKCHAEYRLYKNCVLHSLSQNCFQKHTESSLGYAWRIYSEKYKISKYESLTPSQRRYMPTSFEDVQEIQLTPELQAMVMGAPEVYKVGYALRKRKPPTVYDQDQISWVKDLFMAGEKKGVKKVRLFIAYLSSAFMICYLIKH